jgi:hypothetical protein
MVEKNRPTLRAENPRGFKSTYFQPARFAIITISSIFGNVRFRMRSTVL